MGGVGTLVGSATGSTEFYQISIGDWWGVGLANSVFDNILINLQ